MALIAALVGRSQAEAEEAAIERDRRIAANAERIARIERVIRESDGERAVDRVEGVS